MVLHRIDRDVKRFKEIVRGVVKKEFRKYLTQGELIGRQGKHIVSIPLPQIEIPRFRFNWKDTGGIGQGEGEEGAALGAVAGLDAGEPIRGGEAARGAWARLLGEALGLPRG